MAPKVGKNPRKAENFTMAPKVIIIIDDEPLIRWSLRETLKKEGFTVLEAKDGKSALSHFSPEHDGVSGILLDYKLPDTDGIRVLQEIRKTHPDTPVVMMTAYGTPEVAEQAAQLKVAAFIEKPFDVKQLVNRVRDLIQPPGKQKE
ncbi:Regulatory protein AtoC [Planctomycetaceae bacterium]|nr:Regulatory protein AtoC [Planctomycetaceae bacterium]